MMKLKQFLEKKGEKAHRDAIAMGLQYKGFGYWADPNSGEAKYKTVNDQLVPVTPDEESELYKGDEKEKPGVMSGTPQQGGMAQPGANQAQMPSVGSGEGIQGGLGVDANAPQKKGWDAGPDGDTCVGGQPREEVPSDTFVGKTNNLQWTAGMDGSNAVTELGEMRKMILNSIMEQGDTSFRKELQRKFKADRKLRDMAGGQSVSPIGSVTANKAKGILGRSELDTQEKVNMAREWMKAGKADSEDEMNKLMGTRKSQKKSEQTKGSDVGKGDGPTRAKKVAKAVRGKDVSTMGSDTKANVDFINKAGGGGALTNRLHSFMLDWEADPVDGDPDYTGAMERDYQRGESERERQKEADWKKQHAKNVADRVRGGSLGRKLGGAPAGTETRRDAEYLKNLPTGERTEVMRGAMQAMGAGLADDPALKLNRDALKRLADASGNPEEVLQKLKDEVKLQQDGEAASQKKQYDKDQAVVEQMNQALREGGFFADPEYDMDDVGEKIGEGAFGSVFLGADGDSVVKEGMIGQEELAVLRKLRDNPMFPTLLNAQMQSPFKHQSSMDNNPFDQTNRRRPEGQQDYFNPDEQGEFEDRFPGAFGKYAMSLAKGRDLMDVVDEMYENGEDVSEIYEKVFRARREMHKAGIVHNDMHGGNIKIDDDGNINIIDLGLAEENPLAALFEGMGGISGMDGQFAMGAAPGGFGNMVNDHTSVKNDNQFADNLGRIEEMMMDNLDVDIEDEDAMGEKMEQMQEFLRGGIRKEKDLWPRLKEQFPYLDNDENVMGLIDMLYDGFGENPVQQRMGAAFDRLKNTQDKTLGLNPDRRLRKGEPLVPRKNLDIDD